MEQITQDEELKQGAHQVEQINDHVEFDAGAVRRRRGANTQLDDAAKILEAAGGRHETTQEDRKRVLRKVDLWVCVPMCIVYCLQQFDKSSVK
jgi:hypothetical protein